MSFEFTLFRLSDLVKDMMRHNQDIDEYYFTFNNVRFNAILDIGTEPFQLLLGTINHNWACVLNVRRGFLTSMAPDDFMKLCEILHLKPGKGVFTSFDFLKYVGEHAPKTCSLKPVPPSHIMPFRKKYMNSSDEPDKTVFIGWNNHKLDGKQARNFNKTRLIFGDNVAEFCIKNNISSLWTTPNKATEKTITYPPGYTLS